MPKCSDFVVAEVTNKKGTRADFSFDVVVDDDIEESERNRAHLKSLREGVAKLQTVVNACLTTWVEEEKRGQSESNTDVNCANKEGTDEEENSDGADGQEELTRATKKLKQ